MKKLEEVLEECLSAYLEQGRPVEESLQLYPEYRGRLEPLLRTAIRVSDSFLSYDPPLAVQQRGLARFLSDARGRARLNSLRDESRGGWLAGLFAPRQRLGVALGGVAVALVMVVAGVAALNSGGENDGRGGVVEDVPTPRDIGDDDDDAPRTPPAVTNIQAQIDRIRGRQARGETVSQSELDELSRLVSELPASVTQENKHELLQEVAQILDEAGAIVHEIARDQPETQPSVAAVDTAINDARDVLGIPVPPLATEPPVAGVPTEVPTAGAGQPQPTEPPRCIPEDPNCPNPIVQPTPGPTAPPTSAPTPTDEAREPQVPVFP